MRCCLLLALLAGAGAVSLNPVTRVAELMQGMIDKIEKDGKAEEDLFEGYVCWYKTVTSTKKADNAAAADRIEELSAYIDDVKGGRVEFTSERKDLEAEIAKLSDDIEAAKAMRKKENDDFLAAKDEMTKAIDALKKAVEVLGDATADAKEGVLTSVGFDLRRVMQLGQNTLNEDDVRFLEQALDGEAAPQDWEKLNRKAVFKMKYKARSFKIQEILADMQQTFTDNLKDAEKNEADSKATSDKLLEQKESQLGAAQDALTAGDAEGGARGQAIDEAQEEVDSLTAQVKADEGYIKQADASHATKLDEWKERKRLRTEEIASIEQAIAILTSDEARDTMSSSFKSQGNFFLQEQGQETEQQRQRLRSAAGIVRKLAAKHSDMRLAALAFSMTFSKAQGHFDEVTKGIDEIITDLHKENDMDLKTKEDCENDRSKNTKISKNAAYEIDQATSIIVRKEASTDAKNAEIARLTQEKKDLNLQRDEATVDRRKNKLEYEGAKQDDETAVSLIGKAKGALEKFYTDNGLALVQARRMEPPAAGAAPPPPPTTWSEPYGGAKGENNGVMSILGMIEEDIKKDIKTADAAEKASIEDFDAFMASSEAQIAQIDKDVSDLMGEIGDNDMAIKDARSKRKSEKAVMEEGLMYLRSIAGGCDFMAANFELRKENREAETDGLLEARGVLTGGSFR